MYYVNACCLIHTLLYTQKYMGSGIQTTVKANELSSVMTVCVNGFHNDVMACMLQIDESTIHIIFVALVVSMEAIFSCLNLNDGFLPYSMPKVFNKTGRGLTDIINA